MKKANQDLRDYARQNNVKLWQVAEAFGRSDATFTRDMRIEWTTERKQTFKEAVDKIKANMPVEEEFAEQIVSETENKIILKERLKDVVKKHGAVTVCNKTGIPYYSLENTISGQYKASPRIGTLVKIAKATNTSIDYLVGLSDTNSLGDNQEMIKECMDNCQKVITMCECMMDDLKEFHESVSKRYEHYSNVFAETMGIETEGQEI